MYCKRDICFFQAEDGIRYIGVTGVQTCALPIFVDFHAEATSEKVAMGWYLDGRVTACVGTHTHVPTADARVLPGGTACVSEDRQSAAEGKTVDLGGRGVIKQNV